MTRVEVVAVLAALALLACVTLPALANSRSRSERVSCISNLRQIGVALHTWGVSHGDRMPWLTPWQEEGTMVPAGANPLPPWSGLQAVAWFHYNWVSNELVLPKYLVCPSDPSKAAAGNWTSTDPTNGFRHANFQNKAVSYSPFLHSRDERPASILAADRDFGYDANVTGCSTGIGLVREITSASTIAAWQGTLHGGNGNLLLYDGSVQQVDTAGFRKILVKTRDTGKEHFLNPE